MAGALLDISFVSPSGIRPMDSGLFRMNAMEVGSMRSHTDPPRMTQERRHPHQGDQRLRYGCEGNPNGESCGDVAYGSASFVYEPLGYGDQGYYSPYSRRRHYPQEGGDKGKLPKGLDQAETHHHKSRQEATYDHQHPGAVAIHQRANDDAAGGLSNRPVGEAKGKGSPPYVQCLGHWDHEEAEDRRAKEGAGHLAEEGTKNNPPAKEERLSLFPSLWW